MLTRNLQIAALNILVPRRIQFVRGVLPPSYHSDRLQKEMMDAVSRSLILWHHDFVLHDAAPGPKGLTIEEGQVWYLPSYHVTRGTEIFDWHKKNREGSSDRRSEREFYSRDPLRGRRPAVIVSIRSDNCILTVPCSHNWDDDSLFIEELGSNAVCHFEFRINSKILACADNSDDRPFLKLRESDLIEVKEQVEYWRSRTFERRRGRF